MIDTEALKRKLLNLALQGKIIEQKSSDLPASILLKKVSEEKEALIKSGKIKRQKALPRISNEEIPFEIPETWEWVRWGTIAQEIQYGYNAPAKAEGNIKMVRITDIQDNNVVWESVPYCDIEEVNIKNYLFTENDILFARTGGTVGKSFLVKNVECSAIYAGYLIRTRYSKMFCPEFLKMFMESDLYWKQLRNGTVATAQPNCNGQTLSRMLIPIPPENEQQRIAEKMTLIFSKLDVIDALQKQYASNITSLNKKILDLAVMGKLVPQDPNDEPASVLLKKITEEKQKLIKEGKIKKQKALPAITEDEIPFDIPESWEWVRIGTIFNLQAGKNKTASEIYQDQTDAHEYPCFGGNGRRGFVKEFNRDGFYPLIGRQGALCGNINFANGKFYATEHAVIVETFAETNVLWSGYFLKILNLNQYATATAQPGLSVANINNVLIPVPPAEEQQRIVEMIDTMTSVIENSVNTQ